MTIYYAPSNGGFYDNNLHGLSQIPIDAIEISIEQHSMLLKGLNSGGTISLDENNQLIIIPRSAEDTAVLQAINIRAKRNQILKDSDWTQLPDIPQAIRDIWAAYRQLLRDLPQQSSFPNDIIWPTAPQ
jgi:hypothetical protein